MFHSFHLDAVKAFQKDDYKQAIVLFLQAIEKNPETPESYLYLGKAYFFNDEKKEAIVHLKKYIEFNQHNAEEAASLGYAFDLLGQCYEANNNDNAAITCYRHATKINPLAASTWHSLALLYIKSAQYYLEQDLMNSFKLFRAAQDFLNKALAISNTNPMFLNTVAGWYKNYIDALEKLTENEEMVQKNIDNHFKLAVQYYEKALRACSEEDIGLKNLITENLTTCLAQFGDHLYMAEDFEKALEYYFYTIKLDPKRLGAINQIGMSLFKLNRFPEARKYFLDSIALVSETQDLADAWLNIACTYRMERSWSDAAAALSTAKSFAPEDPAIADEEKKLLEMKEQASLIVAPQIMFSHINQVSPSPLSTIKEDKTLQFN